MAKITQHSDIIADKLLEPTIREFEALNRLLLESKKGFKDILTITKDGVIGNNADTLNQFKQLQQGYSVTKTAAEELANVNLLLAKTEQEQLKTKILLTKETERQAKAVKAEMGAYAQASKTLNDMRKSYKDLAVQQKHNSAEAKSLLHSINALDKELKKIDATVGQHQRNVGNYTSALEGLPGPIGRATSSVTHLLHGFKALIANPIGLTLAAVAAAAGLLYKAFVSTDSGATFMAAKMEQLNAAMNVGLMRFSDTELMLKTFGKALGNLAIGNVVGATENFNTALNGSTNQLKEATAAAEAYVYELDRIEDAEISYISQAALNKKKIADLEFFASDQTKGNEERKNALGQSIALRKEEAEHHAKILALKYLNEVTYAAKTFDVKTETLRAFIEADEKTGKAMLEGDSKLAAARDAMKDEGQDKLEHSYAAMVDGLAEFTATSRRVNSKYTGFLKEMQDQQAADRKAALDKLKKDNDADIKERKRLLDQQIQWEFEQNEEKKKFLAEDDAEKAADDQKSWDALWADIDKIQAQNDANSKAVKDKKEEDLKAIQDIAARGVEIAEGLNNILEEQTDRRLKLLDKEVSAHQKRADDLRALAATGNKDARASIALEEKLAAEAELKKEKALKRAKTRELLMTGINMLNAKIQAGEGKDAVGSTLTDLMKLIAGVTAISGFFKGTEHVATALGKPNRKGKDGYTINVDGEERILPGYLNAQIRGIDNDDLVRRALMSEVTRIPVFLGAAKENQQFSEMNNKLERLIEIEANRPVQKFHYNEVKRALVEVWESKNKVERNIYPGGGLW